MIKLGFVSFKVQGQPKWAKLKNSLRSKPGRFSFSKQRQQKNPLKENYVAVLHHNCSQEPKASLPCCNAKTTYLTFYPVHSFIFSLSSSCALSLLFFCSHQPLSWSFPILVCLSLYCFFGSIYSNKNPYPRFTLQQTEAKGKACSNRPLLRFVFDKDQ